MRKRNAFWWYMFVGLCSLVLLFGGCQKKVTKTPPVTEPVEEEPVTAPVEQQQPIDTSDEVTFNEAELEAEMQRKIDENLRTVYFEFNSYSLSPESMDKLARAGTFLMDNSQIRILVEGHCDERGSSEYNMGLGENRARVVKDYLVNYGIPSIRLEITSWGKERPVAYGCTDESCHSKNRRVEFKVLSK